MKRNQSKQKYQNSIGRYSQIEIINSLKLILQTEYTFKYSSNQRTLIEALLIELIKFTDTKEISEIIKELQELKDGSKKNDFNELTESKNQQASGSEHTGINESKTTESKSAELRVKESLPPAAEKTKGNRKDNAPSSPVSLTAASGDLQTHWITIVDSIKTERHWVYTLLKETRCEADEKGNYIIKVIEQRYDSLSDYKEYLSDKVSSYFGEQVKLSIAKYSENKFSEPSVSTGQPVSPAKEQDSENLEKIESFLKDELNAKEISR